MSTYTKEDTNPEGTGAFAGCQVLCDGLLDGDEAGRHLAASEVTKQHAVEGFVGIFRVPADRLDELGEIAGARVIGPPPLELGDDAVHGDTMRVQMVSRGREKAEELVIARVLQAVEQEPSKDIGVRDPCGAVRLVGEDLATHRDHRVREADAGRRLVAGGPGHLQRSDDVGFGRVRSRKDVLGDLVEVRKQTEA